MMRQKGVEMIKNQNDCKIFILLRGGGYGGRSVSYLKRQKKQLRFISMLTALYHLMCKTRLGKKSSLVSNMCD